MKKKVLLILLYLVGIKNFAQQDAQYTQYMYNTLNFNPAYAGSREVLSVFGLYRNQWIGIDGAPVTSNLAIHLPIANTNLGLGLSFSNDIIGATSKSSIATDVSYTINTSQKYKLAFGLKASAKFFNINYSKLTIYNQNDPSLQDAIDKRFLPNIGVGLYLYSSKSYLGLSVPSFFENYHYNKNASSNSTNFIAKDRLHYYFIGGYVFLLKENIQFKPAFFTKMVQGSPLQLDVSANVLFNEKLSLGVAYRINATMSALVGFQVNQNWFIGYAYDLENTQLANYNSGSHEIFLRYELFNNFDKIVSPRFF